MPLIPRLCLCLFLIAHTWGLWFPERGQSFDESQDRFFYPDSLRAWTFTAGIAQPWSVRDYRHVHGGLSRFGQPWLWWILLSHESLVPDWKDILWNLGADYHYHAWHALVSLAYRQIYAERQYAGTWHTDVGIWWHNKVWKTGIRFNDFSHCVLPEMAVQLNIMEHAYFTANLRRHPSRRWQAGFNQHLPISSSFTLRLGYWYPAQTASLAVDLRVAKTGVSAITARHAVLPPSKAAVFHWFRDPHD